MLRDTCLTTVHSQVTHIGPLHMSEEYTRTGDTYVVCIRVVAHVNHARLFVCVTKVHKNKTLRFL